MAKYTITAIVTKIDSANKVIISGVGKHRYEKTNDDVYNLLEECSNSPTTKLLKQDEAYSIESPKAIKMNLLVMAMLNKKPLKLTIKEIDKEEKKYEYSIVEVEVP